MRKFVVFTLCAMVMLSLAACSSDVRQSGKQISNPFVEYNTIDEAKKAAGFEISEPGKIPEGFTLGEIRVIKNEFADVSYVNGENEILFLKAKGNDDISGDYNEYSKTNTVAVGNLLVTMRGNDNTVSVATWTNGNYTYAIRINFGGKGMQSRAASEMIGSIKQ